MHDESDFRKACMMRVIPERKTYLSAEVLNTGIQGG
jgi:hypothetical protein